MKASNIKEYIEQIKKENIIQETEVRSKIVIPLLDLLEYPSENIAEEYPVYGKDSRKDLNTKLADIIIFRENNANNFRKKDGIEWVMDNSLIVIELKKPGEDLEDAKYQATFYAMWTRCIIYVITNGEDIVIYSLKNYVSDKLLFNDKIINLDKSWQELNQVLNYKNVVRIKEEESLNINSQNLIYLDYCKNKLNENNNYLTEGINRFLKKNNDIYNIGSLMNLTTDSSEKIEYKELLKENRIIVIGNVGIGKTYLLKLIELELLSKYVKEENNAIPIIIDAKGWKKNYDSIEEATYNVLKYNFSNISLDSIRRKIITGEYILLVDGIDEIKKERKTFIDEIINLCKGMNTRIICTCRNNNYFGELDEYLKRYNLDELTDEQIREYIKKNIGEHECYKIYEIENKEIKELMKNPLLLSMIVFVYQNNHKEIPKNKALLYKIFLEHLIDSRPKSKNIEIKLDTRKRRDIIREYACCEFKSNTDIKEIINNHRENLTFDEVEEEILDTGIIVKNEYGLDFYHYSFKEYFIAEYIYNQDNNILHQFIKENIKNEDFYEVIIFLVGMCKDEEKQKIIFDELEKENIELLSKCLNGKYNFYRELKVKDIDIKLKHSILKQLKDSYERIINENFYEFKELMNPWNNCSNHNMKDLKIGIKGNITDNSLQYHFFLLENDSEDVIVDENEEKTKIYIKDRNGNEVELEPSNLQINNSFSFYNFTNSKFNIYSYREIAFEYIGKQLKNLVEDSMFPLMCKNNVLKYEMLEQELRKISRNFNDEIELSLYDNDASIIFDYLKNKINKNSILYLLLLFTKDEKNCKNNMLTAPDLSMKDLGVNSCYHWNLYSKQNILEYISRYYYLSEITYRKIVEEKFKSISKYMKNYKSGPKRIFGYIYIDMSRKSMFGMGTLTSSYRTNDKIEYPYIKLVERDETQEKEKELKELLNEMGKEDIEITTWTSSAMFGYFDKQPLFKNISKKLVDDLKNIFYGI